MNVTDMDGFEALFNEPWMTEWDATNDCVDVLYSLETIGEF